MRLRRAYMFTARVRVGQRHNTTLCEKQSVRLQTVGQQHRAAEVQKISNLTRLFALIFTRI